MRLRPSQVREIAGISQETLRYWRKSFTPIRGRNGRAACFTPAEGLALLVVADLTDLGVAAGVIAPITPKLFSLLGSVEWEELSQSVLILDLANSEVTIVDIADVGTLSVLETIIVVPLAIHVENLQCRMFSA